MQKSLKKNFGKAGILTFHFAHNCGAVLQAYALYKTVSEYLSCEIINYQPEYHASWGDYRFKYEYPPTVMKRIWRVNKNKLRAVLSIIVHIPHILRDPTYRKDKKRTKAFEDFLNKNTKCSKLCRNLDEVNKISFDYDIIFSGSDQVWNPRIVGADNDEAYVLPFSSDIIKCSYAASAGGDWNDADVLHLANALRDFAGVSCREPDLKVGLEKLGVNCRIDIDPTLLLRKEDYYPLEKKVTVPHEYIFIYAFQITDELVNILHILRKKIEGEFISFPFDGNLEAAVGFTIREINPLGPEEFLYLMHHAKYVVVSTFHGLAFATIYKKPFICLTPEHGKNRIENYLKITGLTKHYYTQSKEILMKVDYSVFEEVIERSRKSAKEYIYEMCSEKKTKRNHS